MVRLSLVLFYFLVSNSVSAAAITIYGLEQGSKLKANAHRGSSFMLQIGAFKSKANADNCKKEFAHKTNQSIKVIPPKRENGIYSVVVGPFPDAAALREVSYQLLTPKHLPLAPKLMQAKTAPVKPEIKSISKVAAIPPFKKTSEIKSFVAPISSSFDVAVQKPAKSTPVQNQLLDKPSLEDNQVLLDNQSIEANQISQVMRTTKKMNLGAMDRKSIENRTRALKAEAANIDLKLKTATNKKEIAALNKRKNEVNRELEKIITMVITRISRK
jgi:hypothetical protein